MHETQALPVFNLTAGSDGTHVSVDVGKCINICQNWVSGFEGLKVTNYTVHVLVLILYTLQHHCR